MDHSDLVELVADDLTQSVSRMLVEMGSEDGERFAKTALIKFAKQALSGAPQIGGMNISTFTSRERHACCATIKTPCVATIRRARHIGLSATLACIAHRECSRPKSA